MPGMLALAPDLMERRSGFFGSPKRMAIRLFHGLQVFEDLFLQALGELHPLLVEEGADFRGDGETGRHRYAEIDHLGETRAFPSKEVPNCSPPSAFFPPKK